jgi:hypothetical protein
LAICVASLAVFETHDALTQRFYANDARGHFADRDNGISLQLFFDWRMIIGASFSFPQWGRSHETRLDRRTGRSSGVVVAHVFVRRLRW